MALHHKQMRFGRRLMEAASDPDFFKQAHVIFGGTGAVGGSTALRLMDFFDEAVRYHGKSREIDMHIIVTGLKRSEIREFTSRLFHIHRRRHGCLPELTKKVGYRTRSGIWFRMRTFSVEPAIDALKNETPESFLQLRGLTLTSPLLEKKGALRDAIREVEEGPFTHFLTGLRRELKGRGLGSENRFRSVVIGIPLPSVMTYHANTLEAFARGMGIESEPDLRDLKREYLREFPDDLAFTARELAKEVLVAHTTGVGGMYDEDEPGNQTIRLGFAHSAMGQKLLEKKDFADELTEAYAERNIKMLVTAAAIGVDEILQGAAPPMKADILRRLMEQVEAGHEIVSRNDLKRKTMHVYRPEIVDLAAPSDQALKLGHGQPLVCDFVIRSGENGFFSVANADALYRTMRVASDTELGFALARTAVFGDDALAPKFVNNICYYTETDYSRQVFDLLGQPALRANQRSGLQPRALQDLGSSKHQGEMHLLSLLILLNRLKTLDFGGLKARMDLSLFDAGAYFETHSSAPMLEDAFRWDPATLADELKTLVSAREPSDLARFQEIGQRFPDRLEALNRIFSLVLQAVWAIPSLGSPIIFEEEGRVKVVLGYYAAPVDKVLVRKYDLIGHLRNQFKETGQPPTDESFERFVSFQIANNGFVDVRPSATLVSCRRPEGDLSSHVQTFTGEASLIKALESLEPYSYFATSGLTALLVRLKGLARFASELDLSIGTANDFRAHFLHDETGQVPLVPGVVEAFRMVSEGLEKNTGSERMDGVWGYGWPPPHKKSN